MIRARFVLALAATASLAPLACDPGGLPPVGNGTDWPPGLDAGDENDAADPCPAERPSLGAACTDLPSFLRCGFVWKTCDIGNQTYEIKDVLCCDDGRWKDCGRIQPCGSMQDPRDGDGEDAPDAELRDAGADADPDVPTEALDGAADADPELA